jgi:hypothetical protein
MDAPEMQQGNKGLRHKTAVMHRKQEGIVQDCQADSRTGGHKVSSRDFHQVTESDWTL